MPLAIPFPPALLEFFTDFNNVFFEIGFFDQLISCSVLSRSNMTFNDLSNHRNRFVFYLHHEKSHGSKCMSSACLFSQDVIEIFRF
jgi:hypothetical protein